MYEVSAVRLISAEDLTHQHIDVVGYDSPHLENEVIFIPIPRVIQRGMLGEKFGVKVGEELAEVQPGKCHVCGLEPYLKTTKDTAETHYLIELPQK